MKKSIIIENQKRLIERQNKEILDLISQVKDLKEQKIGEILNKYKYAILVDESYNSTFYNDGRIEDGVKQLCFNHYASELPEIEIHK